MLKDQNIKKDQIVEVFELNNSQVNLINQILDYLSSQNKNIKKFKYLINKLVKYNISININLSIFTHLRYILLYAIHYKNSSKIIHILLDYDADVNVDKNCLYINILLELIYKDYPMHVFLRIFSKYKIEYTVEFIYKILYVKKFKQSKRDNIISFLLKKCNKEVLYKASNKLEEERQSVYTYLFISDPIYLENEEIKTLQLFIDKFILGHINICKKLLKILHSKNISIYLENLNGYPLQCKYNNFFEILVHTKNKDKFIKLFTRYDQRFLEKYQEHIDQKYHNNEEVQDYIDYLKMDELENIENKKFRDSIPTNGLENTEYSWQINYKVNKMIEEL
jgi:hypothetical protein